jgi:hypothetical protein
MLVGEGMVNAMDARGGDRPALKPKGERNAGMGQREMNPTSKPTMKTASGAKPRIAKLTKAGIGSSPSSIGWARMSASAVMSVIATAGLGQPIAPIRRGPKAA